MKLTKRLSISLLACIAIAALTAFGLNLAARAKTAFAAEAADVSHYFYNQLETNEQKEFYHAMEAMNRDGVFIAGEDYDMTDLLTQVQLEAYAGGDNSLVDALGAARDAFYTDYAEIFYVDFGYISLRVTLDGDGFYHAYLGSGRADTYYTKGFNSESSVKSAIVKYETARDAVVALAMAAQPTDEQVEAYGQNLATTVARIQTAHRWIAENTLYRLEDNCTPGNEGHVRTPYGVFVAKHEGYNNNAFNDGDQGEALCEGYSRAFKAIMDKIGVPCVLVNGVYRHAENQEELHMWTHVQLEGEWYAVDQTFDDLNRRNGGTGTLVRSGLGEAYTEDYFLKGAALMNTQHATSPYKSEAEYAFTYPTLTEHNLGWEVSTTLGGVFKVEQYPYDAELKSSVIEVSVFIEYEDGDGEGEWCGYERAAELGYYIVMRNEGNYLPEQRLRAAGGDLSKVGDNEDMYDNDGNKINSNALLAWAYLNPVVHYDGDITMGLYPNISDVVTSEGSYTRIADVSKTSAFEFALTRVQPREYDWDDRYNYTVDQIAEMTTFSGDPTMFLARSGLIKTKYDGYANYDPPPFIVKSTPSIQGKLQIGFSYEVTVEYDQYLELMDGDNELKISVVGMRATGEFLKGTNAVVLKEVVDLDTLTWDRGIGDDQNYTRGGRVSFTFTPGKMFAHDNVEYIFTFNLQGENSKKQANPATFAAAYPCEALCYRAFGYHWSIFGQPQLLEADDLSTEGWKTSDGKDVTETKSRLALVVTSPSKKQDEQMNGLLENELKTEQGDVEEGGFQSFTYNITLSICKGIILETGQGVRISVGFPEGFTYDDSMNGVSYKAYHFERDAQNNVIGVEEIECTVTPLGLILMCKSFSPFAIVAVKGEAPVNADRTVIITSTQGGTAYGDIDGKNSNMFKLTQGQTRKVSIKANEGYEIESIVVGGEVIDITNSSVMDIDLSYDALITQNIVDVKFVAKSVKAAEKEKGETVVISRLKKAVIVVSEESISVNVGEELKLEATVTAYGESNTYQWYKDGKAVAGQTDKVLLISKAKASDAGKYTLKVISSIGSSSTVSESSIINVSVLGSATNPAVTIVIIVAVALIVLLIAAIIVVVILKKRKAVQD